jgi:hypothetical protein
VIISLIVELKLRLSVSKNKTCSMVMSMKKTKLRLFFLLFLFLVPLQVLKASDCSDAKVLLNQALKTSDLQGRLELSQQAVDLCPSFKSWLIKAEAHRVLEQWQLADDAYHAALNITSKEKKANYTKAKIAYVQYKSGNNCSASVRFKRLIVGHLPVSPWILESYKPYRIEQGKQLISAKDIICTLEKKDFRCLSDQCASTCPAIDIRLYF